MADVQANAFHAGSVQRRTVLLLLLCHCFIFTTFLLFRESTLLVCCACVLSFMSMLMIPYNLNLLEMTLERLARGMPVEPISLRTRWLLAHLFVLVRDLSQQSGQQVQIEQRNIAYRDQLLQQVGKTAAQEERNRLARDLHDSIKQQLFSIVVSAAAVKARWENNPASARTVVDDIEHTALEAQVEMQALLQQLRPTALENVGLIESLRMQCQALGYRTGAEVITELGELPPDALFPIGAQEMIFRIVQEGFANIARHARATHVWLSLQQQRDALLVEIGDDGQGFDLSQARPKKYGGMGLSNVRERVTALGGTVSVWSLPGKGTTLHLCLPLVQESKQRQALESLKQQVPVAIRKTRSTLRVGAWGVELAAGLMLLNLPVFIAQWVVFACMIAAFVTWLWAQQYRLQVNFDLGTKHAQSTLLRANSYALLSGLLLLGVLYPNYLDTTRFVKALANNAWQLWIITGVFDSVLILAISMTCWLYFLNADRYYRTLSRETLSEQVRLQIQQVVVDGIMWSLLAALTVFVAELFPGILMDGVTQSIGYTLLGAWFVLIGLKSLRMVRCQRLLHHMTKLVQEQKRGSV